MDREDAATALALAVGFLLVVAVENTLRAFGFATLGLVVYPVGYGTLVLVAWYVWIRPIDFGHGTDGGPGGGSDGSAAGGGDGSPAGGGDAGRHTRPGGGNGNS